MLVPEWLHSYKRRWLVPDLTAGVTLSAVAIPEVMGYASIAQTPIVTGLYTVIVPTAFFALIGSSRLLVVGADSATAAVTAAGSAGLSVAGLMPHSAEWVAWASMVALVCGAMLLLARLVRLGFIGDFMSASVLIGFLSGVGVQVLTGQVPDMLGLSKGSGTWLQQQEDLIKGIPNSSAATFAFALGTVLVIIGFERYVPKVPGAVVAVAASIIISTLASASSHGVAVVGSVSGGFPPLGLPQGMTWSDVPDVLGIAFSCFVLIVAQSAATSRSFAARHGRRVDVNQDILGLSAANLAAGLSGTFVVNGSPTKTQILDQQHGRTQLANLTMSSIVLVFTLFATGILKNMPVATLAGIVFMIGVSLIDIRGFRRVRRRRYSEFVIATLTGVIVFAVGVEQGIGFAIALSMLEIIRRAYRPHDFVIGAVVDGARTYAPAQPGAQSVPGLVVFRFDAQLFYANASRFTDDVEAVFQSAPDPVRWLVLDCSAIDDIDYSAGLALATLVDFVHQHEAHFGIVRADDQLVHTLTRYGLTDKFGAGYIFTSLDDVFTAFRADTASEA